MRYRTKKEILEHLGKDGKDVRYLDRAVASGEIIVRDRMYIVSKEYIGELEKRLNEMEVVPPLDLGRAMTEVIPVEVEMLRKKVEELESENKVLKGKVDKNINQESTVDKNINLTDLKKQIDGLNSDLDFQMAENEKLEKKVATFQECIRNCYRWAQNVKKDKTPRPEFKEKVLKLTDDISGEDNQ